MRAGTIRGLRNQAEALYVAVIDWHAEDLPNGDVSRRHIPDGYSYGFRRSITTPWGSTVAL